MDRSPARSSFPHPTGAMNPLDQTMLVHVGMHGLEGFSFFPCPARGDQLFLVGITGNALDDDVRWKKRQEFRSQGDIFALGKTTVLSCKVPLLQNGPPNDVQEVDLDGLDVHGSQEPSGGEHIFPCLAGEPQDDMGADGNAAGTGAPNGIHERLHVMTPPNEKQGGIMRRLQTKLEPDGMFFGQGFETVEHRVRYTVRARPNREADDLRVLQRLPVQPFQDFKRSVGIGESLEIGQEFPGLVPPAECVLGVGYLCSDALSPPGCPCAGSPVVAVDAASPSESAVPVRSGQTGVQGDLLNPAAVEAAQIRGEIPVRLRCHDGCSPKAL